VRFLDFPSGDEPDCGSKSYFDVECRLVPIKASTGFILDPHDAIPFIDENTIGVIIIMGSTYTGHFENVHLMSDLCAFPAPFISRPSSPISFF